MIIQCWRGLCAIGENLALPVGAGFGEFGPGRPVKIPAGLQPVVFKQVESFAHSFERDMRVVQGCGLAFVAGVTDDGLNAKACSVAEKR